jgi:hypothetical protein
LALVSMLNTALWTTQSIMYYITRGYNIWLVWLANKHAL